MNNPIYLVELSYLKKIEGKNETIRIFNIE